MPVTDPSDSFELPAGSFTAWLGEMHAALRGARDAEVACGTCVACCASGQFVHIAPDETDALAHIPRELLFPAPLAPKGHVLLGYDERGRCPMLRDDGCSIYEHRPRTCRTYDCRVFAAAGIAADEDKPAIAHQASRWRFTYVDAADEDRHAATRRRANDLPLGAVAPDGAPVRTATQRAVAAVAMSSPPGDRLHR